MAEKRSMGDILATAANAAWMDAIASNVANARDESALQPTGSSLSAAGAAFFQPVTVTMSANASGGVSAQTSPTYPGYIAGYDPSAPFANAQGLVALPNVDLTTTIVDQTMALQSYRANAVVFKTAEQMTRSVLNMMV